MSLEIALENLPRKIETKHGLSVSIRPLKSSDAEAFHEFFSAMPQAELLYMKHRVSDFEVIKDWCDNIDLGRILPLLAMDGAKVIGVATLHQTLGGWKRHIGRVSSHTHPNYRGKGVGYSVTEQIIDIARQAGLQHLEAEFMGEQEAAIKVFAHLGFIEMLRLEDYVKDMQAITHDYLIMGLPLTTDEEYAGMG